ncbi:hypothetical protein L798_15575 [Zootermopsis nevadensis]|uniref:Uncharacterized protein n=1 Tax=Zootermopsis nevadensis TaxID=136037 RepID=A0A067RJT5_ZOONE|nr:hypothetical protein L798_15575 [Zootermopsis nevadensis]
MCLLFHYRSKGLCVSGVAYTPVRPAKSCWLKLEANKTKEERLGEIFAGCVGGLGQLTSIWKSRTTAVRKMDYSDCDGKGKGEGFGRRGGEEDRFSSEAGCRSAGQQIPRSD